MQELERLLSICTITRAEQRKFFVWITNYIRAKDNQST